MGVGAGVSCTGVRMNRKDAAKITPATPNTTRPPPARQGGQERSHAVLLYVFVSADIIQGHRVLLFGNLCFTQTIVFLYITFVVFLLKMTYCIVGFYQVYKSDVVQT